MGQMIDEEDCEVCIPFDQEWIFTYGDLVTLLFCFFVLLFSMCVYETEKFKSVASSFKPLPAGTPFISEGRDSVVEDISKKVCLLYTSPSPRDRSISRMPSSA